MAGELLAAAKWLGPRAFELAKKVLADRDVAALQSSRDEHALAAANEIVRMILSGETPANVLLLNLIREYEALLERGAKVPRDTRTMVETLIEKARDAQFAHIRWDHRPGGGAHRGSMRPAAKKSPAKKKAAKKAAAKKAYKRPAAKKAYKRPAAKKAAKKP